MYVANLVAELEDQSIAAALVKAVTDFQSHISTVFADQDDMQEENDNINGEYGNEEDLYEDGDDDDVYETPTDQRNAADTIIPEVPPNSSRPVMDLHPRLLGAAEAAQQKQKAAVMGGLCKSPLQGR